MRIFDWVTLAILVLILASLIIILVRRWVGTGQANGSERRPIYWNLIIFAGIACGFSIIAMCLVDSTDKNEIALLFLGMIGGYAVSIKELDLAKIELEKEKLKNR